MSSIESGPSNARNGSVAPPARLSADISGLTGMPFPNLLYRMLAQEPGRLESCWGRVRDGLALVGAPALRARLAGNLPAATVSPTGRSSLDGQQLTLLTDVLDAYDSGNSCNAVLVRLLLEGAPGHPDSPLLQASPVSAPGARRTLPPMLDLETMPEKARAQVRRLAQLVVPDSDVVPSVFRHFAAAEALLDAVVSALDTASATGELDRISDVVEAEVTRTMAEWPVPVDPVVDSGVRAALEPFATMIPRMLVVSAVLRTAVGKAGEEPPTDRLSARGGPP